MSDFRTKLLGLTSLAIAFAGVSYGAVSCGANLATANNAGYLERVEGETELVSDITLTCGASALTAGVTVNVSVSLPVSSKAITPANTYNANGNSEVVLVVTDNAPGGLTTNYSGSVSGTLITFTSVTFPANFTAVLHNVRVNASLSSVGSAVTESIIIGQNGLAEFAQTGIAVGQVLRGLQAPTLLPVGGPTPTLVPNPITVCQGDVIGKVAPSIAFTAVVAEGFPGAFKLQTDINPTNQESGDFLNAGVGIGTASSSTQITLTIANLPSTAAVYVPLTISYTPAGGTLTTLTLANTQTPAASPVGLTLIPTVQTLGGITYTMGTTGSVVGQLPAPAGGVVTATYNVTATNANQSETFNIPVYLNIPASTAATPLAVQGPITVLEALGPAGPLPATGQASATPLFAATTNTALNAQPVVACLTTLLFPYVTNSTGFETGIAIANTSTDNLGTGGASVSAATNGTCTINFYGNQTQPAQFAIPPTGTAGFTALGAFTTTTQPIYANILSAMSGLTNFTGYAIAQCNFLEAHGFAFIADGSGNFSGVEGYLAVVIPNTRNEQVLNLAVNTQN